MEIHEAPNDLTPPESSDAAAPLLSLLGKLRDVSASTPLWKRASCADCFFEEQDECRYGPPTVDAVYGYLAKYQVVIIRKKDDSVVFASRACSKFSQKE